MEELSRRLGVAVEEAQLRFHRGLALPDDRAILYRPTGYVPRDQFTIAHELMELHCPRPILDLEPATKERFCNRGAAALLMPQQQFQFSLRGLGWDLPRLRQRFALASWGAIAQRLVDLVPHAAACTWVDGKRKWWRWDEPLWRELGDLADAEHGALAAAESQRGHAQAMRGRIRAKAWRLTARNGARVMLTVARARMA